MGYSSNFRPVLTIYNWPSENDDYEDSEVTMNDDFGSSSDSFSLPKSEFLRDAQHSDVESEELINHEVHVCLDNPPDMECCPISLVPDEVLTSVFSLLSFSDRQSVSIVSKRWRMLEVRLRQKLRLDYVTCNSDKPWGPHRGFMDAVLEKMLPRMCSLKEIEISNLIKPEELSLTDDGLMLIGTWCKQLEKLQLRVSSAITGQGITAVVFGCGKSLRDLELYKCPGVGREALKAIADYCPILKTLSLRACVMLNDEALSHLAGGRCCPNLQRLELELCQNVGDKGLEAIAKNCSSLVFLDLSRCDVTDHGISWIASRCQKLEHLVARGCSDLSNVSMKAIAVGCQQIKELDVRRSRWISSTGLRAVLNSCPTLKKVWVDDIMMNEEVKMMAKTRGVDLASFSYRPTQLALTWYT